MGCTSPLCFNIPEIAGFYSQLAGTMAGFSIAALFFVLTFNYDKPPSPSKLDDLQRVLIIVLIGVVCLGISSLIFASIAGMEESSGRAASEQLAASSAFIFGATALLYGVSLLCQFFALSMASSWSRWIGCLLVPALCSLQLTVGVLDLELKRDPDVATSWVVVGSQLALVVYVVLVLTLGRKRDYTLRKHEMKAGTALMVGTVVAAGVAGFVGSQDSAFILPQWSVAVLISSLAALLSAFGVYAIRCR